MSKSLRVHLWDFGGQNIQYYLHQFFLTQNSLHLLVLDDRKDCESVDYWSDIIQILGDSCPVLVVQNEKLCHGASGFSLDQPAYSKRHGDRLQLGFYRVDLSKKDGRLEAISDAAQRALSNLEHIGDLLPIGWIKGRERVNEISTGLAPIPTRPHIPWRGRRMYLHKASRPCSLAATLVAP